jgi:hypothetical protein
MLFLPATDRLRFLWLLAKRSDAHAVTSSTFVQDADTAEYDSRPAILMYPVLRRADEIVCVVALAIP